MMGTVIFRSAFTRCAHIEYTEVLEMGNRRIMIGVTYLLVVLTFAVAAYGTSMATTTVAQMIPLARDHTIVIDAGHGGVDGGATSCTGVLESQFNLEISLKLEDLFHLLGYKTKMIRRTDISVYTSGETIAAKKVSDLRQRVKLVMETENPILISIHQNTFPDSKYAGAQVFYAPGNEPLARELQESLVRNLNPGSNRNCKEADGVYLMQHVSCPAVLVECGFLSNPAEESKLRDAAYQQKLCSVIGCTTAEFLTK